MWRGSLLKWALGPARHAWLETVADGEESGLQTGHRAAQEGHVGSQGDAELLERVASLLGGHAQRRLVCVAALVELDELLGDRLEGYLVGGSGPGSNENACPRVDGKLPPRSGCHPLLGNRAGQFALKVSANVRMIVVPDHEPVPRTSDGGIDPSKVTRIQVIEVIDYLGE